MAFVEKKAKKMHSNAIELKVAKDNLNAIKMYVKLKFKKIRADDNLYSGFIYKKELK